MIRPAPSRRTARLLPLLLAAALLVPAPAGAAPAAQPDAADGVVEQGRYAFGWNGLTAAVAEFKLFLRFPDGRPTFHFEGSARTTDAVDLFWRMRDTFDSVIDGRTLRPERFQLLRRENAKRIDVVVVNDTVEKKFRIRRTKRGTLRQGSIPSPGVYDPVSAMLLLRQKPLEKGDVESVRVLEGKRVYVIRIKSLGKERVDVDGKVLRAVKLAASYRSEDGRRSSEDDGIRNAYIWVADEPTHALLRLEADAPLGVVFGERLQGGGA